MSEKTMITVQATVNASPEQVWKCWTEPEHIKNWTFASDDWHAPYAENDLKVGGKFSTTMAAKDGSFSFDFGGVYDAIAYLTRISYTLEDDRTVAIDFENQGTATHIVEKFEAETENPVEMQQGGWQAILNNFKKYVENLNA